MSPAAARVARAAQRQAPVAVRGGQRRPAGRAEAPGPRLRVLAAPARVTWRPSFVAACVAVLVASLLAVLVINLVLSRGAYAENQLELRQIALTEAEQALAEELALESSPSALSARARELGMIPNASPAFIRLADGRVLGKPTPADATKVAAFSDLPGIAKAPPGVVSEEEAVAAQAAADAEAARPGGAATGGSGAADLARSGATVPPTPAADGANTPTDRPPADPGDGAVPTGGVR